MREILRHFDLVDYVIFFEAAGLAMRSRGVSLGELAMGCARNWILERWVLEELLSRPPDFGVNYQHLRDYFLEVSRKVGRNRCILPFDRSLLKLVDRFGQEWWIESCHLVDDAAE